MKIDFHTHGKLAKRLPFSPAYTDWLFAEAEQSGLDGLCLTEHFNTWGFEEVYGYIRERYSQDGDCFRTQSGFRIFPGMEVDIEEGGHILVIGPYDAVLEMNRRLEPYKEKGHFLPLAQLEQMADGYPVLLGAGHPYREGGTIPKLEEGLLKRFDFLDLNGKDLALHREITIRQMEALSRRLRRPLAAGSDTHQSFQYGCVWNEFERDCTTVEELRREIADVSEDEIGILRGRWRIHIAETVEFQVKTAGILKRALKEIHSLGGDYVSVLLKGAEI